MGFLNFFKLSQLITFYSVSINTPVTVNIMFLNFFYLWWLSLLFNTVYTLKMLGCFNPTLGQIWTNPAVGLNFYLQFLTQKLG